MERTNTTTVKEEIANSITHGLGAVLAIIALVILIITAAKSHQPVKIAAYAIYGASLILMYLMSTLYHGLMFTRAKRVFRILDHTSIFLLIAGSFTPFIIIMYGNTVGWRLLASVWIIAVGGILFTVFNIRRTNILLAFYLLMGWLGLFIVKPLAQHQPVHSLILFMTGGILYTAGTIFYKWKKLAYHHGIWHLFVLSATACHFLTILHL
jgi:hemolysin III